jgi:hypothetical protein
MRDAYASSWRGEGASGSAERTESTSRKTIGNRTLAISLAWRADLAPSRGDVMPDLPTRPDLEQIRHQAKDLLRAARSGDGESLVRIRAVSPRLTLASGVRLCQLAEAETRGSAPRGPRRSRRQRAACAPRGGRCVGDTLAGALVRSPEWCLAPRVSGDAALPHVTRRLAGFARHRRCRESARRRRRADRRRGLCESRLKATSARGLGCPR